MSHALPILFAQANQQHAEQSVLISVFMMSIICAEVGLIIVGTVYQVWYFIVKIQALSAVAPHNREMEPAMIFLIFIPFFGFVWYFIVVTRIAESLRREYQERGLPIEDDFGRMLGIAAGALNLTCVLTPIGLICGVMHLFKLRRYTKAIEKARQSDRPRWRDALDVDDDYRDRRLSDPGDDRIQEK